MGPVQDPVRCPVRCPVRWPVSTSFEAAPRAPIWVHMHQYGSNMSPICTNMDPPHAPIWVQYVSHMLAYIAYGIYCLWSYVDIKQNNLEKTRGSGNLTNLQ